MDHSKYFALKGFGLNSDGNKIKTFVFSTSSMKIKVGVGLSNKIFEIVFQITKFKMADDIQVKHFLYSVYNQHLFYFFYVDIEKWYYTCLESKFLSKRHVFQKVRVW